MKTLIGIAFLFTLNACASGNLGKVPAQGRQPAACPPYCGTSELAHEGKFNCGRAEIKLTRADLTKSDGEVLHGMYVEFSSGGLTTATFSSVVSNAESEDFYHGASGQHRYGGSIGFQKNGKIKLHEMDSSADTFCTKL